MLKLGTEYALFQSTLPADMHKFTIDLLDAKGLDESARHDEVPDLILRDPAVHIAVASLLGLQAKPDDCRHIHLNSSPLSYDWHLDDYCGELFPPGEWAYMFYFPQDTPVEMGPTAALIDGQEVIGAGPAGTCLLVRHTTMHRATGNTSGKRRYMLKYLFRSR